MDNYKANRQFERFLFLTPHDNIGINDEEKLIATITYDFKNKEVRIEREDEKGKIYKQ
jgi:hypothetical protein